ncbi:response regulator [bacterium]|nr:response regulator [bacterium]
MMTEASARILLCCENLAEMGPIALALAEKSILTLVRGVRDLTPMLAEGRYQIITLCVRKQTEETLSILRQMIKLSPQTCIVLVNGHPNQELLHEAFRLGIKDFFPAPVNQALLIERIEHLLSSA